MSEDSLPTKIRDGLCRAEIYTTFWILGRERLICPPNGYYSSKMYSDIVAGYVEKYRKVFGHEDLGSVAFDALRNNMSCTPETRTD